MRPEFERKTKEQHIYTFYSVKGTNHRAHEAVDRRCRPRLDIDLLDQPRRNSVGKKAPNWHTTDPYKLALCATYNVYETTVWTAMD
jgi:hypothetical protein